MVPRLEDTDEKRSSGVESAVSNGANASTATGWSSGTLEIIETEVAMLENNTKISVAEKKRLDRSRSKLICIRAIKRTNLLNKLSDKAEQLAGCEVIKILGNWCFNFHIF